MSKSPQSRAACNACDRPGVPEWARIFHVVRRDGFRFSSQVRWWGPRLSHPWFQNFQSAVRCLSLVQEREGKARPRKTMMKDCAEQPGTFIPEGWEAGKLGSWGLLGLEK